MIPRSTIPTRILLPIARVVNTEAGCTPPYWGMDRLGELRERCGPDYADVPLGNILRQCENYRKGKLLGRVDGSGVKGPKNRGKGFGLKGNGDG